MILLLHVLLMFHQKETRKHRCFAITAPMKSILLVVQHGPAQQLAVDLITSQLIIRLI
jgi:hypothetical protein